MREFFRNKFLGWEFDDYTIFKKCGTYKEDFKETNIHVITVVETCICDFSDTTIDKYYNFKFWYDELSCSHEYEYYCDDQLVRNGSFDGYSDSLLFGGRYGLEKIGYIYECFVDKSD